MPWYLPEGEDYPHLDVLNDNDYSDEWKIEEIEPQYMQLVIDKLGAQHLKVFKRTMKSCILDENAENFYFLVDENHNYLGALKYSNTIGNFTVLSYDSKLKNGFLALMLRVIHYDSVYQISLKKSMINAKDVYHFNNHFLVKEADDDITIMISYESILHFKEIHDKITLSKQHYYYYKTRDNYLDKLLFNENIEL